MAKDLFNRYVWLVDTIYRAGRITLGEINRRWLLNAMSGGEQIPLRTFHNHRKAIEELFDINIECDKRGGYKYYIENADDMRHGEVRSWLLNTFAVNNLINESRKLRSRILFEHIPSGRQYLTTVIEAMRDGFVLEMTYQSFWRDEAATFEIEPYCVKVFRQRWYMVGRSPWDGCLRIYSLDRVKFLAPTAKKFAMPRDFDAAGYFADSFGIIVLDEQSRPETIEVKVYGKQVKYFRALPLHHSQQESVTAGDHSVFSYYVKPTYDLRQELLSHGAEVEVLSPGWLRAEVGGIAREQCAMYESKRK